MSEEDFSGLRQVIRRKLPPRNRHLQGRMEAAGIEPASGSLPNGRVAGTFRAEFDLGKHAFVRIVNGTMIFWVGGKYVDLTLEEAIPQLERVLETAKLVYYGALEAT